MMTDQKFKDFKRRDLVYSRVNGYDFNVTILTPEGLQGRPPSRYPVLVHWHGGGFITGHRLYAPWWPDWFLEFALSHNAIIISPDHRLVPEANGTDILDDVEAFSNWMHDELPFIASQESWQASPDLNRVAAVGASSGGYLAVQMAVLFSTQVKVKAIMSVCGPLSVASGGNFTPQGHRKILGSWPPPPREAQALIRSYIRSIKPGAVRLEGNPADMWPFLLSLMQQAMLPRLLGVQKDPRLDLLKTLDKVDSIPPLWISHSAEDSIIPVQCSLDFAKAMETKFPKSPLHLSIEPGDHMWSDSLGMSEPWVQEGCDFINQFWV